MLVSVLTKREDAEADIHSFRVQIDSTIKFVLFGVELHKASSLPADRQ